ncbi:MAG: TraR/DksA C4-type zinc finger protein [Candidatus Kerfeldbacteria bacterium]|nr:TraR/DksA C4-type zinc finger protein [Candidatus Kerfeldbacteria bacterium]
MLPSRRRLFIIYYHSNRMASGTQSIDQAFIDEQKERLEQEKERLEKQLHGMTGGDSFDKDTAESHWSDMGDKEEDNAIEVAQFQDSISLERNLEEQLEQVNSALARMEDDRYGVCEVCGNAIEEDRLRAYPGATKCMTCASKR